MRGPRNRAFRLSLGGYSHYPDLDSGEPITAAATFIAAQKEGDDAVRRAMHHQLDLLLANVLPKVRPRDEWVVWRTPGDWGMYTHAHLVKRHANRKLETACGKTFAKEAYGAAIFGGPQLAINWGACPDCKEVAK